MTHRTPYLIPKSKAESVIRDAIKIAKSVKADQLNCSISIQRQPTDKSVEEVLRLALDSPRTLWNFIFHQDLGDGAYYDIGCCTMTLPTDYFLWIVVDPVQGEALVAKHGLEKWR
jgi:hypothetical protein